MSLRQIDSYMKQHFDEVVEWTNDNMHLVLPTIMLGYLLVALQLTAFVCTASRQQQAAKFADTYAQSLKAIHDTVDTAFVSGKLTPAERQTVYQALLRANEAGLHLNAAIRGVANATAPVSAISAAIREAQSAVADGTAAIKDPQTKATIQIIATAITNALDQIARLYARDGGTQ